MEFNGIKCPVCQEEFKDGDDIVVCPECGAPHHRACYEKENRCAFEDKHSEGFEYDSQSENESSTVRCGNCGFDNPKTAFYCSKCGSPLNLETQSRTYQNNRNGYQNPQSSMPFGFSDAFDPMGGVNPEEDMGDNVTAGELSKYVRTNTPYFMRVFSRLKLFDRGKFSLAGFLFGGWYLLYRKMYKLGAVLTSLSIAMMIFETYIEYSPAYTALQQAVSSTSSGGLDYFSGYTRLINAYATLDGGSQLLLALMGFCSAARLVIQIVTGCLVNRWYFSDCKSKVKKIKVNESNPNQAIESKGGVNLPLAASMFAIYFAINVIPMLIFGY